MIKRTLVSALALGAVSLAVCITPAGVLSQRQPPAAAAPGPAEAGEKAEAAAASKIEVLELDEAGLVRLLQRPAADSRPLLINFWATWCEPCRKEFPDLVKINEEFRPTGDFEFVTVSLDDVSEIRASVPQFLAEMRASGIPAYLLNAGDPETAIAAVDKQWRGELPATFLYGRRGEIAFKHMGRINREELRTAIKKALSDGR
jgi:thiol-disulfide isomerase/thioredoxin